MRYLRVIAFLSDSISNRVYKLNTIFLVFAVCVIALAGCGSGSGGGNESSNHPPFVLTELDVYIDENDPMAMFDLPKGVDSDGQPLSYRVTSIPNHLFGVLVQQVFPHILFAVANSSPNFDELELLFIPLTMNGPRAHPEQPDEILGREEVVHD